MSRVNIRPYSPADLETCVKIFRSNIPEFFYEHELPMFVSFLEKYGGRDYWCILEGDRIVGCGGYYIGEDGQARLCWGIIHQDQHRRGFGRRLAEFRVQKLIQNPKVVSIGLDTSQHNPEFFKKFGFKPVSVEKNKYGPGLDSHEMILVLKR